MRALVTDLPRVLDFVRKYQPLAFMEGMQGIGLEDEGELKAGVVYEGYNGHTVWMHVAAVPGGHWLTRNYLHACFAYPFLQLRVPRVRAYVEASNARSMRFSRHLGFVKEAVLGGAASDGGDLFVLVMARDWCRYIQE
jgi:RimJ/RimL family protein N-acetyltransferase